MERPDQSQMIKQAGFIGSRLSRGSQFPKNRAREVVLEKWQPNFYILGEVKSFGYCGASG
jgi:hypothetical protein